jgi:16S rRNA (uracil1498-N3)-methyltransferase
VTAYDFAATRLFVEEPLGTGMRLEQRGDRANFLLNVLRLRDGAELLVFNGRDGEWRVRLAETTRKTTVLVVERQERAQAAGPDIDYCFAPLKHARLDYMVQKAVEMGAARLRPVITRRTQATRVNLARMRANAVEAAEQCGILAVPEIVAETSLDTLLAAWEADRLLVVCDEDAPAGDAASVLASLPAGRTSERLALLVGPEGGFDPAERARLLAHPAVLRLSLGPRILRADTAAVAGLTLLQAFLGDWKTPATA